MAQLMQGNQSKYVPLSLDKTTILAKIPLHGDQLFEERARNVKWTFQDGDCSVERLDGLEPEFADWHAKFTLYKVQSTILEYDKNVQPAKHAELALLWGQMVHVTQPMQLLKVN
jgi:hypothetical protein